MTGPFKNALGAGALLTAVVVLTFAFGCGDALAPMNREDFVAVLVDLHLVEARREIVGDMPPETRDSIFVRHGITTRTYERAVRYYTEHPDEYLELYNQIIDSLSAELGQLEESGQVNMADR